MAIKVTFFNRRRYFFNAWELKLSALVLDRDGVINFDSDSYIKSVAEWVPIEGSIEAIAKFSRAGFRVVIITNQSGLARGLLKESTLQDIHWKLESKVESLGWKIDGVFFCPHHPKENCECRKPKTGLLKKAEHFLQVSLKNSFFVGSTNELQKMLNRKKEDEIIEETEEIIERPKTEEELQVEEEKKLITPELVRATSFSGSSDELVDRIRQLGEAGYSQFAIQLVHGQESALEEWADVFERV